LAPIGFGSAQPPIGLDIGTDYVRAAQVRASGGGFTLSAYGRAPMPYGAVVEGEILDPQAAGSAISELWKRSGFRSKDVAIGLANQKVVVRLIDLPFMEKAELQGAIQYQAQDYIPIPVEEAILSHDVIGDYMTPADEHMMEVLLVAAAREVVDSAVQTVESAGLKLARIDLTAFAIVRALIGVDSPVVPDTTDEGATGIIHITSGLTNIAVVEGGVPRFTRVSALAGKQFTQAIANVMNLTYDEAEQLKMLVGLPSLEEAAQPVEGVDAETVQAAQQALERETNRFIAEVRRSLDYYLTQANQASAIKRIVLTGTGATLRNLPQYLEKGLQTQVTLGDPLAQVRIESAAEAQVLDDRMGCAPALGLGLGGVS